MLWSSNSWKVNELEFIYSVFIKYKSVSPLQQQTLQLFYHRREHFGVLPPSSSSSSIVVLPPIPRHPRVPRSFFPIDDVAPQLFCSLRRTAPSRSVQAFGIRILLNANESSSTLCTNELSYVQYVQYIDVNVVDRCRDPRLSLARRKQGENRNDFEFCRANSLFTLAMTRIRRKLPYPRRRRSS